jgi:hypothetical protein
LVLLPFGQRWASCPFLFFFPSLTTIPVAVLLFSVRALPWASSWELDTLLLILYKRRGVTSCFETKQQLIGS